MCVLKGIYRSRGEVLAFAIIYSLESKYQYYITRHLLRQFLRSTGSEKSYEAAYSLRNCHEDHLPADAQAHDVFQSGGVCLALLSFIHRDKYVDTVAGT